MSEGLVPPDAVDVAAPGYSFDAPAGGSLRSQARSGVVKTGLAQFVRLLVQFGSVIVLSRLLPPAEFGLLAMAGPLAAFAALFQDLGLSQAVVQRPALTQSEVSALFAVSVGTSILIALLLALAAPLASRFYHEPRVGLLMAAMGANVVLGGVAAIHAALLARRLRFGVLAVIDAVSAVAGLLASIIGALALHTVWALYLGNLVAALVMPVGYWAASAWRPALPRRRSGVGGLLHFGANVTGFNVANFFARNLDNVLIGRVWGDRPLGLYDRAYKLLLLPLQQINGPMQKVMLPILAQMAGEPERYRRAYLRTLSQMLLVTLPGIAWMVGTSSLLIPTLLGRQWADSAPIFAVLGLAGLPQALNNPSAWLFVTQDRTRAYAMWGAFGSVTCIASFLIGLPYGPAGVAISYTVGEYLRTPLLWWFVTRRGPVSLRDVLVTYTPHYIGAAASLAMVAALRQALSAAPPLVALAATLLAAYATTLAVVAMSGRGRDTLRHSLGLLRLRG